MNILIVPRVRILLCRHWYRLDASLSGGKIMDGAIYKSNVQGRNNEDDYSLNLLESIQSWVWR